MELSTQIERVTAVDMRKNHVYWSVTHEYTHYLAPIKV